MKIVPYRPESILSTLQRDFEDLSSFFQGSGQTGLSEWMPKVDIKEEGKQYVVCADIPGVDPKNVTISVENNILTIKGERNFEQKEEKGNYNRIERSYGSFYRQFSLPGLVESNGISAKYKNGVLEVVLPKQEGSVGKNIDIKVEN